jgi:hypothetical protein
MTYARHSLVVFALWSAAARAADRKYDTKTASFAISYHGEISAYRDTSIVVQPGAVVVFKAVGGPPGDYAMKTNDGILVQKGLRHWQWSAPRTPGTYKLTAEGPGGNDAIKVHAFVMVPASAVKNGMLNGYRIGAYPNQS